MKRFFFYSLFGTALVFLIGGFFLLSRLMQFRAEIEALKDEGFPVAIADLKTEPIAGQVDATKQFSRLLGPLGSFETEMYEDPELHDRDVDETAIELFNDLNTAYPTVYPLISEIANSDYVGFEKQDVTAQDMLDFELLERLQKIRSCARVLQFKARIFAAQDKPDEALQATMEIFKLCDAFEEYPTLVAHLVRLACQGIAISSTYEILSEHEITQGSRDQLNELLDKCELSDGFRWTLVSERAFGSSLLSEMGTVQLAFSGMAYLELIESELEQCDKEAFEQDLTFEDDVTWFDGVHAAMILPALKQARLANSRLRSRIRSLRIISALTAKPESVEKEVTKEYLLSLGVPESMTVDTMNGKPMKVKRSGDHWVVYSVGENLVDDGGTMDEVKDFVVGPE